MQLHEAQVVARTLVLRVVEQRALRAVASPGWQRLHRAADALRPAYEAHVARALGAARAALGAPTPGDVPALAQGVEAALGALGAALAGGLTPLLLRGVQAGGQAAAMQLVQAGGVRQAINPATSFMATNITKSVTPTTFQR